MSLFGRLGRQVHSLRRLNAGRKLKGSARPFLEPLEDRVLLTAGKADPFVQGLYQVLLQRTPAPAEVNAWASAMSNGFTPAQVVDDFLTSGEFNGRMVRADYRNLLGREPEPGIANYWLSVLGNQADYAELTAEVLASPEYFGNHGDNFQQWVVGLYRDVLGREASAVEQNGWLASLQAGTSRIAVTRDFVHSHEADRAIVEDAYHLFLGREPETAGLDWWTAALDGGLSTRELASDFVGSQEFANDFQTGTFPGPAAKALVPGRLGGHGIVSSFGSDPPVVSSATFTDANGDSLTLQTTGGTLSNVQAVTPPSGTGATFPWGLMSFEVDNVPVGGTITVTLTLPAGAQPATYYKWNQSAATFSPFMFDGDNGASISGNVVTLYLTDGGAGDQDGQANGIIIDPGGLTGGTNGLPPDVVPQFNQDEFVNTLAGAQGGNPMTNGFSPSSGVRYADGAIGVTMNEIGPDLGFGVPWDQTVTWSNGTIYASGDYNGSGMIDTQLPYMTQGNTSGSTVAVVTGGTNARTFDNVSGTYYEHEFLADSLVHNSGTSDFTLTDTTGRKINFYDFSTSYPANQRGAFESLTDPGGNVTSVTAHTSSGNVQEVQRSSIQGTTTITDSWLYTYITSGTNSGLLQNVTWRQKTNSGAWSTLRQVAYAYYDGSTDTSNGSAGDLKTATIEDGSGNTLDTAYYRYYVSGQTFRFPESALRLDDALGRRPTPDHHVRRRSPRPAHADDRSARQRYLHRLHRYEPRNAGLSGLAIWIEHDHGCNAGLPRGPGGQLLRDAHDVGRAARDQQRSRRHRSDQQSANVIADLRQQRRPGRQQGRLLQPERRDLQHGHAHRHAQYELLRNRLRLRQPRPAANHDHRERHALRHKLRQPQSRVEHASRYIDQQSRHDGQLCLRQQHARRQHASGRRRSDANHRPPQGGAADRVTEQYFDWRDRVVATKDGVQSSEDTTTHRPIWYYTYDNLDEVTQAQHYDGDGVTITSTNGVPNAPSASLLREQTAISYDDQQRVYQTVVYDVNQSTGSVSSTGLTTNTYYNHRGQVIEVSAPDGLVTKDQYDGAGRVIEEYQTDGASGTSWSAAGSPSGDNVLQQTDTQYNKDGNPILVTTRQRFHNETATGALGNISTAPKARVSYVAYYYDAANRPTATVNVGTNGGSAYTRPANPPSSSPTVLVTTEAYNAAGWIQDVVDPRGLDLRVSYDNLDRTTQTIEDYTNGTPTATSNKTTNFTYDGDDHVLTLQAVETGDASETTQWVYGVTTGQGSNLNSNDLLYQAQYPDPSTGSPSTSYEETYTVNALSESLTYTDRAGNVHSYGYDVLGRETSDAVTTLATGFDNSVLRIQTAYDALSNPYLVTSYNAASGGSIVNQVQQVYNGLDQLITEYQAHSGAVNTSTTPKVQYSVSVR
jgi:YD repeat-containing protein